MWIQDAGSVGQTPINQVVMHTQRMFDGCELTLISNLQTIKLPRIKCSGMHHLQSEVLKVVLDRSSIFTVGIGQYSIFSSSIGISKNFPLLPIYLTNIYRPSCKMVHCWSIFLMQVSVFYLIKIKRHLAGNNLSDVTSQFATQAGQICYTNAIMCSTF